MSEQYDNRGKASLWKNDTENPKAPLLKGHLFAHRAIAEGEQIEISLWKGTSDNPNAPVLRGNIQDKYVKQEPAAGQTAPSPIKDDIPF